MKTSRIASAVLAVGLAFGAAACDADGTTASDDIDSVEDGATLDTGTTDTGTTDMGTTTDTATTGTDG